MATLELLIDGSRAVQGAQQVETALRTVTTQAERTATTVRTVGPSLTGAFQLTGGGVQVATGIASTAAALGTLNTQAAAFSAARAVLDIGNVVRDFREFRGAVGGVSTVFGTLGAVIRANPIGAIATALGIAATAMGLFGGKTKEAAVNFDTLAQSVDKAALARRTSQFLGEGDGGFATGQAGAIRGALQGTLAGQTPTLDQIANLLEGRIPALRLLAQAGNSQAQTFLQSGEAVFQPNPTLRPDEFATTTNPNAIQFTNAQAQQALRAALQSLQSEPGFRAAPGTFQFGSNDPNRLEGVSGPGLVQRSLVDSGDLNARGDPRNFVEQGSGEQARAEREAQIAAAERISESMERAAQFGEQIGASVGDAAAQLLFAGRSLRDVVGNLVRQFATQGLRDAGAGIFGAITRGVAGGTQAQAAGDSGAFIGPPIPSGP